MQDRRNASAADGTHVRSLSGAAPAVVASEQNTSEAMTRERCGQHPTSHSRALFTAGGARAKPTRLGTGGKRSMLLCAQGHLDFSG